MAKYVEFALDGRTFDQIFGTQYGFEPAEWLEVIYTARTEKAYKRGMSEAEILKEMEKRKAEMEEDIRQQRLKTLEQQQHMSAIEYEE